MVIERDNPKGIDSLIAKMQSVINERLSWANLIYIYPRCYIQYRDNNITVEHYLKNGDYVMINNAEQNKCFFVLFGNQQKQTDGLYSAQLDLYFALNLKEIYPDVLYRCDEDVRMDVLMVIERFSLGLNTVNVNQVITGIDNVYRGVYFNRDDDTQPHHCFKIRLDIKYDKDGYNC